MYNRVLKISILSCLFLSGHILIPSILANTPIKTATGFIAAKNICLGDELFGYSSQNSLLTVAVTNISLNTTNTIIVITTNKGEFHAAPDQLFYDPITAQWIAAKEITTNTILLNSKNNHYQCLDIKTIFYSQQPNILSLPLPRIHFTSMIKNYLLIMPRHSLSVLHGFLGEE